MTMLNKYAAEICRNYEIHGCTDVTGFGFLGHLREMLDGKLSCQIWADRIPVIREAAEYADEFLLTAAGQRNRNFAEGYVEFCGIPFSMEEILFDPQTSGGLLIAAPSDSAEKLEKELQEAGLPARIVGELTEKGEKDITVYKEKKG